MTENDNINALRDLAEQANGMIRWEINSDGARKIYETVISTLDLINRQKAEIERLKEEHKKARAYTQGNGWGFVSFLEFGKNQRAEAIKECIEKTQAFLAIKCRGVVEDNPNLDEILWGYRKEDVDEFFDNLVKEMVGDTE